MSRKAAAQLYAVIRRYVPHERVTAMLTELACRVDGNRSYHDTVREVARLHEACGPAGAPVED